MEAEICDLDELTGSALASDSSPLSFSLLQVSSSLSFSRIFRAASRSRRFVLTVPSFGRPLTSRGQVCNDLRRRRSGEQTRQKDEEEPRDRTNIALGVPRPWGKASLPRSPVVS